MLPRTCPVKNHDIFLVDAIPQMPLIVSKSMSLGINQQSLYVLILKMVS